LPDPALEKLKPKAHKVKLAMITNLKYDLVGAMKSKLIGVEQSQEEIEK
jgi:hypothetical protein